METSKCIMLCKDNLPYTFLIMQNGDYEMLLFLNKETHSTCYCLGRQFHLFSLDDFSRDPNLAIIAFLCFVSLSHLMSSTSSAKFYTSDKNFNEENKNLLSSTIIVNTSFIALVKVQIK